MQPGAREPSTTDEPSNAVILRQLAAYLLPEDKPEYRWRIGGALALLVAAKGLNVAVRISAHFPLHFSDRAKYDLPGACVPAWRKEALHSAGGLPETGPLPPCRCPSCSSSRWMR